MGHDITALIGSRRALSSLVERFGPPAPTELPFGLILLPLGELRLDMLSGHLDLSPSPGSEVARGFNYLDHALKNGIAESVGNEQVLYIETNYFGGIGSQGAAYFREGELVWRESMGLKSDAAKQGAQMSINRGLAELGVVCRPDLDEFDSVGLNRFRSLEALGLQDWEDED